MRDLRSKLAYFIDQAIGRLGPDKGCPNCSSSEWYIVDRKAIVSELRECQTCHLMYRYPLDHPEFTASFYQQDYEQGFTTEIPDQVTLEQLKRSNFYNHEKCYTNIINLLSQLNVNRNACVFDYGCSWGYGSWQFAQFGYNVTAYEISELRGRFAAEHLHVNCLSDLGLFRTPAYANKFDVFFSNHVIEHVPKPTSSVELAKHLLKPGGLFIAITPNGSLEFRERSAEAWHRSWGKVHPNQIGRKFWQTCFEKEEHFIGGLPGATPLLSRWAEIGGKMNNSLDDPELLCVARI